VLRGRTTELSRLTTQIGQPGRQTGSVTLIEGGPGTGKSCLLSEASAHAQSLGISVASAAARPEELTAECGALVAALCDPRHPLLADTATALLDTRGEQRQWLAEDLLAPLAELASRGPVAICLDDAHWSDSATISALEILPERLGGVPIRWVIAYRLGEASPALLGAVECLERAGAQRIVLGPLDAAAVAEVTADMMLASPDAELLKLAADVGGNPLLLTELLAGLREDGLVSIQDGEARLLSRCLPRRFRESLRDQLDRLSAHAREAALAATALGKTFSFSDLGRMLQRSPAALLDPVIELIEAGIVTDSGDHLGFAHALLGEALSENLPLSARRALDIQAVALLCAPGPLPVEVAERFAASSEPGDDATIVTLVEAGAQLAQTDPHGSARVSELALELMDDEHRLWGGATAQQINMLDAAGEGNAALSVASTALSGPCTDEQRGEIRLGVASLFSTAPEVRIRAGQAALKSSDLPRRLAARHRTRLACNLLAAGRSDQARAEVAIAGKGDDARRDEASLCALHLARSGLAYVDACFVDALRFVDQAARISAGEDVWEPIIVRWRCHVLDTLDRDGESYRLGADALGGFDGDRHPRARRTLERWQARHLLRRGDLAEAQAILERNVPVTAGSDSGTAGYEMLDVAALAQIAIHTADQGRSRRWHALAVAMLGHPAPSVRHCAGWALTLQAIAAGDWMLAHHHLCQLPAGASGGGTLCELSDEVVRVRVGIAVGDSGLVNAALGSASRRAALNPGVASIVAVAAHVRGLAFADPHRLEEAAQLLAGTSRGLDRAAVLEDLANLARHGHNREATDQLDQALLHYRAAGASGDDRRVRARLRSFGVRRRLVAVDRPERGWSAMTGSETAVAELVVTGLTNRQVARRLVVSPHTVNSHLRNVFTKLDVRSRGELALVACARD
jgi:DNA-binding CsgD family transcriptional regulator